MSAVSSKNCSICLEDYTPTDSEATNCAHVFHSKCLRIWLQHKTTCPLCSQPQREQLNSRISVAGATEALLAQYRREILDGIINRPVSPTHHPNRVDFWQPTLLSSPDERQSQVINPAPAQPLQRIISFLSEDYGASRIADLADRVTAVANDALDRNSDPAPAPRPLTSRVGLFDRLMRWSNDND